MLTEKAALLVGSPMCTQVSALMHVNTSNIDPVKLHTVYDWALKHSRLTLQLYQI